MKIGNQDIGGDNPPYVVSEISGNHCGSLDLAKRLIKAAKRAGASAVKTQCYDANSLTLDINKTDFIVQDGLWKGRTLYDLYSKAQTPPAWHKDLYKVAKDEGITIFSSVFDYRGVDLLEALGCPCFKIASFEIVDLPLIEYAAKTGKPLIISTGLARDVEIIEANDAAHGNAAFLHCTSDYPGTVETADLGRMHHIGNLVKGPVGISDHTTGAIVPIAATALHAAIIEKHLKLDLTTEKSEDDSFSLGPHDFKVMVDSVRLTWEALKERKPASNGSSRQFRRSLYAVKDIAKGEPFTMENVRSIRPGYGLPPKMLGRILTRKAAKDLRRGDPLS